MYFLIAGSILFFATHFYSAFRSRMQGRDARERMGIVRFMGAYSLLAGAGLGLMVWGYSLADPARLAFTPPAWGRHVTLALMLPAFILLVAAYAPRGSIKQTLKHPMLIAVILWSGGHLLANGEMRSLILFAGFLIYALIAIIAATGRPPPVKRSSITGDLIAVVLGAALYYVFIQYLHPMLIGVPVIAGR